jgi:protein phosphatase
VVNIGDSRTYRLDPTGLNQLSVDHSLVQEMISSGVLDEETARGVPFRNVLKRAVLGDTEYPADVSRVPINEGDRILVCSDGVSSVVEDPTISEVLTTIQDPAEAAQALVDAAKSAGGHDDATAVVVDATAVDVDATTRPVWRAPDVRQQT